MFISSSSRKRSYLANCYTECSAQFFYLVLHAFCSYYVVSVDKCREKILLAKANHRCVRHQHLSAMRHKAVLRFTYHVFLLFGIGTSRFYLSAFLVMHFFIYCAGYSAVTIYKRTNGGVMRRN